MKTECLILGQGGLLGKALFNRLCSDPQFSVFHSPAKYEWENTERVKLQIRKNVRTFGEVLSKNSPWMVFWAAGSGIIGATEEQMERDKGLLDFTLKELEAHLASTHPKRPGTFFFASSAGGVYGTPKENTVTEFTPPNPISHYGRGKLRQEGIVRSYCSQHGNFHGLIGRISSLYGVGQNFKKSGQGFISQLSRSILFKKPINIFVPLDTLRDYLFTRDCADAVVRAMGFCMPNATASSVTTKIFSSGEFVSLARILGIFSGLNSVPPGFLMGFNSVSSQHSKKILLRSEVLSHVKPVVTPIEQGIFLVHQYQLQEYLQGRLPQG